MSDEPELDLTGRDKPAEGGKRGPGRPRGSSTRAPRESGAQQRKQAGTRLITRLEEVFDRIGHTLTNRGDDELGAAFVEDQKLMAGGLVNITRRVKWLRPWLLIVLDGVEPLLAFGRVLGILYRRARDARAQALEAAALAQAEYDEAAAQGVNDGEPAAVPAFG